MLRPTLIKSASEEAKQFSFAYADYADAETRKANPFQTSFPPSRSRWRQWRFMHPFFHRATTEQKPTYFTASKIRREREWESGRGCWCRFTVEVKVMGVNGLSGVPLPLAGFLSTPAVRCFQELCFRRHGENAHLSVPDLRLESPERRTNTMSSIW